MPTELDELLSVNFDISGITIPIVRVSNIELKNIIKSKKIMEFFLFSKTTEIIFEKFFNLF